MDFILPQPDGVTMGTAWESYQFLFAVSMIIVFFGIGILYLTKTYCCHKIKTVDDMYQLYLPILKMAGWLIFLQILLSFAAGCIALSPFIAKTDVWIAVLLYGFIASLILAVIFSLIAWFIIKPIFSPWSSPLKRMKKRMGVN